jgi:propionate CoA-transferase
VRASTADADDNVGFDQEAGNLVVYALATAAHNSGGKVIFQARHLVERDTLQAQSVCILGVLVDAIAVDLHQMQNYERVSDSSISREKRVVLNNSPQPFGVRKVAARWAYRELRHGAVLNFGFGMPDGVAKPITERDEQDLFFQTVEHRIHGGNVLDGIVFGTTVSASPMIDSPSQFDFNSGGGLDIAFLGMGEFDGHGKVNLSMLDGMIVGPGGFIEIAKNARKVVLRHL